MENRSLKVDEVEADEMYSLTFKGAFSPGGEFYVCVSRHDNTINITAFQHFGFEEPTVKEGLLGIDDWLLVKRRLEEAEFWTPPKSDLCIGLDGWNWTIDGKNGSLTRSHYLWCPDKNGGPLYDLGMLLIQLSGLEDPIAFYNRNLDPDPPESLGRGNQQELPTSAAKNDTAFAPQGAPPVLQRLSLQHDSVAQMSELERLGDRLQWPEVGLFNATCAWPFASFIYLHGHGLWLSAMLEIHGLPDPPSVKIDQSYMIGLFWEALTLAAHTWSFTILPAYILMRLTKTALDDRLEGDFTPWPDRGGLGIAAVTAIAFFLFGILLGAGVQTSVTLFLYAVLIVVAPAWGLFRVIDFILGGPQTRMMRRKLLARIIHDGRAI